MKWLPQALADIERLHAFLHDKNPAAAARAVQAILDGADILTRHPSLGRPMPDDSERREWFARFGAGAYVLRYKLDRDEPIIIRVWHSRENRI